jgi:DNA invertase Pin-like site-specific DNA recombinase
MLEDANENKFDIILAKELSRLVRNIGLSEDLKKVVMNNKIHVWTLDGAINTVEDDISKYDLYAWLYEEESRRTSNHIKDHMRVIAESGRYIKGEAPYGYYVDDGKLITREDEVPQVVRLIFKQYIDGHVF